MARSVDLIRSSRLRLRDLPLLLIIVAIAVVMRIWAPWDQVFGQGRVDFLETDAWYHVRVIEHQVRNFPHRLTHDPYATPGGMYVPLAPLFDTLVATAVWITAGTQAPAPYIERVSALAPPVMGTLAVLGVWVLGTLAFDRRAGLIAALLAAILPGHFLDRTLVGFVDHHALEALLSMATLASLVWAIDGGRESGVDGGRESGVDGGRESGVDGGRESGVGSRESGGSRRVDIRRAVTAGVFLGGYLLAWGSGAFFVAILAVWTASAVIVARDRPGLVQAGRIGVIAAATAWLLIAIFQDHSLYRYDTQVTALAGWFALSIVLWSIGARGARAFYIAAAVAAVAALAIVAARPGLIDQVRTDVARFSPDTGRMAVLEARPLFLYSGHWSWQQPWVFFRTGFYLGAIGAVLLAASAMRSRRLDHALVAVFTASVIAATLGQNRFGYYLVPAAAVVIGWLAALVLDWGGVPHAGNPAPQVRTLFPLQREVAVVLVAGVAVAPNLVPAALTTARTAGMPQYWQDAMQWLRTSTPAPFAAEDYYDRPYPPPPLPRPSFSVMNWWDQGYWIIQTARRVPVSNPTQVNASVAGRFYITGDEHEAVAALEPFGARYVLVDWELPFRETGGGSLGGRFENLVNWAGLPTATFYQLCYVRAEGDWRPQWLFREAYYQSMAYRLMVLGGGAAEARTTWAVRTESREDVNGLRFCEVVDRRPFASVAEATQAAAAMDGEVVGLDPWQPAFAVAAITRMRPVFEARSPGQAPAESPMVRIFELVGPGPNSPKTAQVLRTQ